MESFCSPSSVENKELLLRLGLCVRAGPACVGCGRRLEEMGLGLLPLVSFWSSEMNAFRAESARGMDQSTHRRHRCLEVPRGPPMLVSGMYNKWWCSRPVLRPRHPLPPPPPPPPFSPFFPPLPGSSVSASLARVRHTSSRLLLSPSPSRVRPPDACSSRQQPEINILTRPFYLVRTHDLCKDHPQPTPPST
jgi:hypothetical protein